MIHHKFTPKQLRFLHSVDESVKRMMQLFREQDLALKIDVYPVQPPEPPRPPLPDNVVPIKRVKIKVWN